MHKCIPSLKFKASTYIRLEATLLMSINKYHMRSLVQSLSSRVILSARGRGQSREIIMKLPWNFLILPWHSSMSSYLDTCSSSLIGQQSGSGLVTSKPLAQMIRFVKNSVGKPCNLFWKMRAYVEVNNTQESDFKNDRLLYNDVVYFRWVVNVNFAFKIFYDMILVEGESFCQLN